MSFFFGYTAFWLIFTRHKIRRHRFYAIQNKLISENSNNISNNIFHAIDE